MPQFLTDLLISYGYLAIFCMVLLQEMGMPGLPNEWVLFYFGYSAHKCGLGYTAVIGLVIIADMIGSFSLFLLFYHGRSWLMRIKPRWLKLGGQRLAILKQKIIAHEGRNIFMAKLTPFVRSYIPVAAGLLQVSPLLYGRIIFLTAIIWSGGIVTVGWLLYI